MNPESARFLCVTGVGWVNVPMFWILDMDFNEAHGPWPTQEQAWDEFNHTRYDKAQEAALEKGK